MGRAVRETGSWDTTTLLILPSGSKPSPINPWHYHRFRVWLPHPMVRISAKHRSCATSTERYPYQPRWADAQIVRMVSSSQFMGKRSEDGLRTLQLEQTISTARYVVLLARSSANLAERESCSSPASRMHFWHLLLFLPPHTPSAIPYSASNEDAFDVYLQWSRCPLAWGAAIVCKGARQGIAAISSSQGASPRIST